MCPGDLLLFYELHDPAEQLFADGAHRIISILAAFRLLYSITKERKEASPMAVRLPGRKGTLFHYSVVHVNC
ncbi:hypothetical protein ccbrp13_44540 [Ktedonobacteria bacterium brp13]|nr:hypothetical protein ccbrp13_44540 [Ktedonobacteria bacterium brp13]